MNYHPSFQAQKPQEDQQQEDQEEEERARCEWDFNLHTVISSNCIGGTSDTLGAIEFDPSDQFFATGGIARKIRIYTLNSTACNYNICTPAKLSSLGWKPNSNSRVLGSGDYDGVVTEYDLERCMPVFERDEHGGRCVWSLDYNSSSIGASGSDDGTMQMWDSRCDSSTNIGMTQPSVSRSPVCSVEFDPYGGELIAMGCSDRRAYVYDLRKITTPVTIFDGHKRTVSYVRFLGEGKMVSAGTDGCLKMWDIMNGGKTMRTYKGHCNNRNFVGLSVWRNGGLLGCGSESDQVFVYDKRWGNPMWVHGLEPMVDQGEGSGNRREKRFVSSVCWRQVGNQDECTLVAGGSDGVLQVFVGTRRRSSSSSSSD